MGKTAAIRYFFWVGKPRTPTPHRALCCRCKTAALQDLRGKPGQGMLRGYRRAQAARTQCAGQDMTLEQPLCLQPRSHPSFQTYYRSGLLGWMG